MSVTEQLAELVVRTRFEDLPDGVIEHARERVLDTIAVMVGGSVERCTQIAHAFIEDTVGNPVCHVVAQPQKTSPPNAAFVNGVAAHSLDYDETSQMVSHVTPCTFPAILAAADAVRATGRDILVAYVVAFEVHARIGWGTMPVKDLHLLGWHPVPTIGSFGAAAGAARILGLDAEATRRALGIAGSETGGIRKNIGTMTKPFHAGNAARNGVVAAMLASRGFTADLDILEGVQDSIGHDHWGFCDTFCGAGNYDLDAMVKDIGQRWELDTPRNVTTKRHPGATARATPMDITIELAVEHDIAPGDIERIDVGVTTEATAVSSCRHARDGLEARYNLTYDIAVSALDRRGGLEQYTDRRVQSPDVQAFMQKVNAFADPEMDELVDHVTGSRNRGASRVTIHLKDGTARTGHRTYTTGYPQDPMLWDDIVEKYIECAEYAGLARRGVDPERLVALVENIENLEDGTRLMACLSPAG